MKKRGNGKLGATLRGAVLGVLITVLALGVAVPGLADAVMKNIEVYVGDVKIYIDGNLQHPTDVNGNTVQPFIYQGTTYLPVRALTNMLTDKTIGWDGETKSVFIGTQPKKTNTPLEELEPLNEHHWAVQTGRYATYSINGKEYSPNNVARYRRGNTVSFPTYAIYKLDKQYAGIQGNFVLSDYTGVVPGTVLEGTRVGEEAILSFYEVDAEGKERLIADYSVKTETPVNVFVDLSGIDLLKIAISYYRGESSFTNTDPVFYDVNLVPEWIMD